MRSIWIIRIHKSHEYSAQFLEVDRLGQVRIETAADTLLLYIPQYVCRESNYWHVWILVLFLPLSNFPTRFVAVLVRHVEVAEDHRVVSVRLREDSVRTFYAIYGGLCCNRHLC